MTNRETILDDIALKGVVFDLIDGEFAYCDQEGLLSKQEIVGLEVIAPGLTEHLRRQRGICIACGTKPACVPNYRGIRVNRSQEAREAFVDLRNGRPHWNDPPEWADLGDLSPPLWCPRCWTNPRARALRDEGRDRL